MYYVKRRTEIILNMLWQKFSDGGGGDVAQFVGRRLVIERLLVRSFRRCVLGKTLNANFLSGHTVYPSWWPSPTEDLQTESQKGRPMLA